MEINSYTDYIVERQELATVITVIATLVVFSNWGFIAAIIPFASFHLGAYLGYRRFRKKNPLPIMDLQ